MGQQFLNFILFLFFDSFWACESPQSDLAYAMPVSACSFCRGITSPNSYVIGVAEHWFSYQN
jgi:hypothetical protein